jgi:hypothetical protein
MTDPSSTSAGVPVEELPLFLSQDEMTAARDRGTASLLSDEIDGIVWFAGTWWVGYERGWLRITDEHVLADLDQAADRLAAARMPSKGDTPCSSPHS